MTSKQLSFPIFFFICFVLSGAVTVANTVKVDLLGGIGDFEYCGDTFWNVWANPDYDFDNQSGWVGDYRSTVALTTNVARRIGRSGYGDRVSIHCISSRKEDVVNKNFEFTDGGGASKGCTEVNIGSDPSPSNAALKLKEIILQQFGENGIGALTVSCNNNIVYIAPCLHWQIKMLSDSDPSDIRLKSTLYTWRYGVDNSTPGNSVAVGWTKKAGESVHPRDNTVFNIAVGEGLRGSNCQYFAIKNYNGLFGSVSLSAVLDVHKETSDLHPGDFLTFKIDSIKIPDYGKLPGKAQITFKMGIKYGDHFYERPLDISKNPFSSEVSYGPLPAGVTQVSVYSRIDAVGDIGQREIGAYIDGAHVYVKRANHPSEYATWEVPVKKDRTIKTIYYETNWGRTLLDIYKLAESHDTVVISECCSAIAAKLRYLNPQIKIYFYEGVCITDYRDLRGIDPWVSNVPVRMGWLLKNGHNEWLYDNNQGGYCEEPLYPKSYNARLSNKDYADTWCQKVKAAAVKWKADGIFIDALEPLYGIKDGNRIVQPVRDPWEVQMFLRNVLPTLRGTGLAIMHNICAKHLRSAPGTVYIDPSWTPSAPYNKAQYKSNSPDLVADHLFQEWAFFSYNDNKQSNVYNKNYWKLTLDDMDTVAQWNKTLANATISSEYAKSYYAYVLGKDNPSDPAYGENGWLNFGLTSYLLAQNDWTTFAYALRPNCIPVSDFSNTSKLGIPDGGHKPYNTDECCRYRYYKPGLSGSLGGVVVVNGNHDISRVYELPFNASDTNSSFLAKGTKITLPPHTGRIFFRKA